MGLGFMVKGLGPKPLTWDSYEHFRLVSNCGWGVWSHSMKIVASQTRVGQVYSHIRDRASLLSISRGIK